MARWPWRARRPESAVDGKMSIVDYLHASSTVDSEGPGVRYRPAWRSVARLRPTLATRAPLTVTGDPIGVLHRLVLLPEPAEVAGPSGRVGGIVSAVAVRHDLVDLVADTAPPEPEPVPTRAIPSRPARPGWPPLTVAEVTETPGARGALAAVGPGPLGLPGEGPAAREAVRRGEPRAPPGAVSSPRAAPGSSGTASGPTGPPPPAPRPTGIPPTARFPGGEPSSGPRDHEAAAADAACCR